MFSVVCVMKQQIIQKIDDLLKIKPFYTWEKDITRAMDFIVLLSAEETEAEEIRQLYFTLFQLRNLFSIEQDENINEN